MTTQSITTLILGTAPENATPATHILAGPWCTAPASAEETGFDMPPEPLADPERLETAARQARQLVTQLAPRLRDYLNGLYGTQHDDRYWDFVLAPSDPHERRNDLGTVSTMHPVKLKYQ